MQAETLSNPGHNRNMEGIHWYTIVMVSSQGGGGGTRRLVCVSKYEVTGHEV